MSTSNSLDAVLKDINKHFNKNNEGEYHVVAQYGINKGEKTLLSLGSPGLDFCTYNSIPEGVFIELTGAEGSGKTLLSYLIAADYIRKESEKAEEDRRHILFVDAEGTVDPIWALTAAGYDMNDNTIQTVYLTPLGQSAEEIFDAVRDLVLTGKIGLVIFDSLTAVAPQQVNEESFKQKEMGGISKPLADFVKRCTGLFMRYKTTFIGINGLIMNISGYGSPETTPGGTYWRRACSLRLKAKRGAYFNDAGEELKASAEDPKGHIIEVALLKSKFCKSDRKLGRCHLHYEKGIDILWDTIEVATQVGIIDDSIQGSYKFINPDTGEYLTDKNGEVIKIRGKANLKPYLEEHLDLWKKIYDEVYKRISIKDDPNIKSFESLLKIDVAEEFNVDLEREAE